MIFGRGLSVMLTSPASAGREKSRFVAWSLRNIPPRHQPPATQPLTATTVSQPRHLPHDLESMGAEKQTKAIRTNTQYLRPGDNGSNGSKNGILAAAEISPCSSFGSPSCQ
jgi:hypothetical protein